MQRASVLIVLCAFVALCLCQVVNIPLFGNIPTEGEFWAPLSLGTPPQPFKLQIDTGSADLLVYSVGCKGCGSNVALFDLSDSSTGRRVYCKNDLYNCAQSGCSGSYCDFDDRYGDGSHVSGQVITDVFTIGNLQANISFGMIEDSSQNFEPPGVDGIWGLAWYTISDWNGTSAFQNVVNQLGLRDRFAMCLTNTPVLQLGGPTTDDGLTWANVIQKSYYVVQMNDLQVDSHSIGVSSKYYNQDPGCIVDSGTTLLLVPSQAFSALYTAFHNLCNSVSLKGVCGMSESSSIFGSGGATNCADMDASDIAKFPNVTVVLSGADPLSITGQDYLLPVKTGCYTLGIVDGQDNGVILGDVFIQRFFTVFDRTNMRVGFGDLSLCPSAERNSVLRITDQQ